MVEGEEGDLARCGMLNVARMEGGIQNGVRTDHDRDPSLNRVNGATSTPIKTEPSPDKGKRPADATDSSKMIQGGPGGVMDMAPQRLGEPEKRSKMNDLPEELVHITQNFMPLDLILTRLAQRSHNELQEKVLELARMKVPSAMTNGNVDSHSVTDDTTRENIDKKAKLLNFAQDLHAKWVKALVISEWSKKSELVSKLIDINTYIFEQRQCFDNAFDNFVNLKRSFQAARLPSPDLKTALQALSTGTAPWMPEVSSVEGCCRVHANLEDSSTLSLHRQ